METEDEPVADEAGGAVVAVEPVDLADDVVGAIGDLVEEEVVGGDEPVAEEMFAGVAIEALPVGAAGAVEEDG